jgi:hypothetical protein
MDFLKLDIFISQQQQQQHTHTLQCATTTSSASGLLSESSNSCEEEICARFGTTSAPYVTTARRWAIRSPLESWDIKTLEGFAHIGEFFDLKWIDNHLSFCISR